MPVGLYKVGSPTGPSGTGPSVCIGLGALLWRPHLDVDVQGPGQFPIQEYVVWNQEPHELKSSSRSHPQLDAVNARLEGSGFNRSRTNVGNEDAKLVAILENVGMGKTQS